MRVSKRVVETKIVVREVKYSVCLFVTVAVLVAVAVAVWNSV